MSDDNTLVLASANVFGYRLNVSNTAGDDGLSPTLVVQLPRGMVLENSVSACTVLLSRAPYITPMI